MQSPLDGSPEIAITSGGSLSTKARAVLSQDATHAVLNTVAHAAEHCAVDAGTLSALGSAVGRQVLVRRSRDRLALYTIADRLGGASGPAVHVGTSGATRLRGATSSAPAPTVTLETDFASSDDQAPVRLTEELLGDEVASGLAILAPHGGRIEMGTDVQARLVYDLLAERAAAARAWIVQGFNPAIGAHACWHITSSEISEHSFPMLGALFGGGRTHGPFADAVAFHGHNDSDAIVIGGGLPSDSAQTALKHRLRAAIRRELQAVSARPVRVEVRLSGELAGTEPQNIVNRITVAGNGIQLEQPLVVRANRRQRTAIARAVADFYWASVVGRSHQTQEERDADER